MPSWLNRANCHGLPREEARDFWSFDREAIDRAKAVCVSCPVKVECLMAVGDANVVAGGKTKLERLLASWHLISDESESNFS